MVTLQSEAPKSEPRGYLLESNNVTEKKSPAGGSHRGYPNRWNEQFQVTAKKKILEKSQKILDMPETTPYNRLEKYTLLSSLAKDFAKTATR
jgi:hypothetical protein